MQNDEERFSKKSGVTESDKKVAEIQAKLTKECKGDFFNLLSVLTNTNNTIVRNKQIIEDAKVIFEESNPQKFDYDIKAKLNPKMTQMDVSQDSKYSITKSLMMQKQK